jgi:mono/diheme cytochrome c family protein
MSRSKTVIFTLLAVFLASLAGGVAFIYSGCFNVSARWEDPALLKWAIIATRERSLEVRKAKVQVPANLDDPQVVLEGFKHYRMMCVGCHRAPGLGDSDLGRGLNPPPPNFAHLEADDVDPPEYFLIIRDGIRMTAMPAWGVTHGDEKIWAIVAFLKKLPGMILEQYQALAKEAGLERE